MTVTYFRESSAFLAEQKLSRIERMLNQTEATLSPAFNRSMDLAVRNFDDTQRKKTIMSCFQYKLKENFKTFKLVDSRDPKVTRDIFRIQGPVFRATGSSIDPNSENFSFYDGTRDKIVNPRVAFHFVSKMVNNFS